MNLWLFVTLYLANISQNFSKNNTKIQEMPKKDEVIFNEISQFRFNTFDYFA